MKKIWGVIEKSREADEMRERERERERVSWVLPVSIDYMDSSSIRIIHF